MRTNKLFIANNYLLITKQTSRLKFSGINSYNPVNIVYEPISITINALLRSTE